MSLDRLKLIAKVLRVDFTIRVLVLAALFAPLCSSSSSAAERLECVAEPLGKDWHYRTKVPGFNGNVRGDRCWYDGPSMKPRGELYWPGPQAMVEMTPLPQPRPARNVEFEDRWEGLWESAWEGLSAR